jgi:hypothetical protein
LKKLPTLLNWILSLVLVGRFPSIFKFLSLWDLNSMPPSGSVLLMPGAGDSNPYGRRCANPYCSSLQDEQGPLYSPDGSNLEFVHPISSSSSVNLNPTELRFLLIAIWLMFNLIPLDLILHSLRCSYCVRIISITATLVNVGFAMFVSC